MFIIIERELGPLNGSRVIPGYTRQLHQHCSFVLGILCKESCLSLEGERKREGNLPPQFHRILSSPRSPLLIIITCFSASISHRPNPCPHVSPFLVSPLSLTLYLLLFFTAFLIISL